MNAVCDAPGWSRIEASSPSESELATAGAANGQLTRAVGMVALLPVGTISLSSTTIAVTR